MTVKNKPAQKKHPKPKMVGFRQALRNFFKGYFNFSGTATRAELWWVVLSYICYAISMTAILMTLYYHVSMWAFFIGMIFLYVSVAGTIIPNIALFVRRIHDCGFNAGIYYWPVTAEIFVKIITIVCGVWFGEGVIFSVFAGLYVFLYWATFIMWWVFALKPSKENGNKYRIN